jgi:hypothetical protein
MFAQATELRAIEQFGSIRKMLHRQDPIGVHPAFRSSSVQE